MKEIDYDGVDWSKHFYYDTKSPTGLRRNEIIYSGQKLSKVECNIGDVAGSKSDSKNRGKKTWCVFLGRKSLKVHRIILRLHGHSVNGVVVDHIDGNSCNNNIENLRVVTMRTNSQNRTPQCNTPYGIPGVGLQEVRNNGYINAYFIARWNNKDGIREQRNFSIDRLGVMEAFKQATITRLDAIRELNLIGMDYTDRHIKSMS